MQDQLGLLSLNISMLQLLVRNGSIWEQLVATNKSSLPHTEAWYEQQHPSIVPVDQKWRQSSAYSN